MYRWNDVLRALAELHGAYPDHLGALRGRLQHFQKLGLAPPAPGRGKVLAYSFHDVAKWAFGLELIECGIDPNRIALQMSWLWLLVGPTLESEHEGEKIFIAYPTMLITQAAEQKTAIGRGPGGLVNINVFDKRPPRFVFDVEELIDWRPSRAIMISLTQLRERLVRTLADVVVDRAYADGSAGS